MTPRELAPRFAAYYRDHPTWGSLHIVLDDQNVADSNVDFCIAYAEEHGDTEGAELARILRGLSRSQRGRVGRFAESETPPEVEGVSGLSSRQDVSPFLHG